MDGDPEKTIIEVLKKHPEGLAITEIANLTHMNRLTAAKYVHSLLMRGEIHQRKIGAVKLCYLKKYLLNSNDSKVVK